MTLFIQILSKIIKNVSPVNTYKHTEVVDWSLFSTPSFNWSYGRNS
jgi:hypothetical protein